MRCATLGPSSVLVRVLIGAKGEQRVLAAASSKQQAAEGGPKVLATTRRLETGIQEGQNDRGANAHHHKNVSCGFELFGSFYGQFCVQKWPFLGCFQDDRRENSGRSLVCPLGATPRLKTGIQVPQNNWGANPHHGKQVLCRFEPSSLFYARFSAQK